MNSASCAGGDYEVFPPLVEQAAEVVIRCLCGGVNAARIGISVRWLAITKEERVLLHQQFLLLEAARISKRPV